MAIRKKKKISRPASMLQNLKVLLLKRKLDIQTDSYTVVRINNLK